jgi:hypothetical protein
MCVCIYRCVFLLATCLMPVVWWATMIFRCHAEAFHFFLVYGNLWTHYTNGYSVKHAWMPSSLKYDYHYYNSFKLVMFFLNINIVIHMSPFLITYDHGNYVQFWTSYNFLVSVSENTLGNCSYNGPPYYAPLHALFYQSFLDFYLKPSIILNYNSAAAWFCYATLYAQCLTVSSTWACTSQIIAKLVTMVTGLWFTLGYGSHAVLQIWICMCKLWLGH